jgi:excisionase family DNA binding protein
LEDQGMDQADRATNDVGQVLITVPEAARRLAISRSHLYQHLQRGTLPSVHLGRARRIRIADLESFVKCLQEMQNNEGDF